LLDQKMRWVVVPGTFEIMVGKSAQDIALKDKLEVTNPNTIRRNAAK
jgi:beta-glucosidase